jgi:ankyrin repeat protein
MKIKLLISSLAVAGVLFAASGSNEAATIAGGKDVRVAVAASQGDRDAVAALIKQKADVNIAQGDGMTALHWAAFKDDLELTKMLLAAGASVKATTRNGSLTPIMMAAKNGNAAMLTALLKAGASATEPTAEGMTPLMAASLSGNADAAKVLIDAGADVNAKEKAHGQTALMFAAAEGRAGVIKLLASRGADLKVTTEVVKLERAKFDDDGNPLPQRPEAVPAVGGTVTGGNTVMGGMTALLFASREGMLDAVKALVTAGAEVNQVNAEKSSPLIIAIANAHYTTAKYLVDAGADVNLVNSDGLTPLYATINMQYAPVSWAPNPLTDQEKVTHIELLKALLDKGADPNVKLKKKLWFSPTSHDQQWVNPVGATPFWRAAQADDAVAMKLLVSKGADYKLVNSTGSTALHMAAGLGYSGNFSQTNMDQWMDAVKYLVEDLKMDVNAADNQGYTPVMGAAWRGNNNLIQYLVDHGAKLDARNKRGWSVTDMANGPALRSSVPMVHPETIAFLEKLGAPELTKVEGEAILGSARGRGRGPAPAAPKKDDPPKK